MLLEDDDDVPVRAQNLANTGTFGSRTQVHQLSTSRLGRSTSRFQPSYAQPQSSSFVGDDEVLRNMRLKMESASTDIGWVIRRCQGVDSNLDGVIYVEDFLRIFQEECSVHNQLTKRELNALTTHLSLVADPNRIRYGRLREFTSDMNTTSERRNTLTQRGDYRRTGTFQETEQAPAIGDRLDDHDRWHYADDHEAHAEVQSWAVRSGSVGEWLFKKACPAERRNFVKLIEALERFEAQTGMKISRNETTGELIVPLGPALRAKIEFTGM